MRRPERDELVARVDRLVTAAAALGVVALGLFVLLPLWAPLVFAIWTAVLLDPIATNLTRYLRQRSIAAGVTTALVVLLLLPIGSLLVALVTSVTAFVHAMLASAKVQHAIEMLVASDSNPSPNVLGAQRWLELAEAHGATALRVGQRFAGAGAWALITVLVFFVALYQCLAQGRAIWHWVTEHAPLNPHTTKRLAAAFVETGRGLMIGAGLTSLLQVRWRRCCLRRSAYLARSCWVH